jgi:uncharacterized protein (TIGR02246 family)
MGHGEVCGACGSRDGAAQDDRAAVVQLITTYARAIDDKDAPRVAELFAEDCLFRVFQGPKGEARGREELSRLVHRLLATFTDTSHHVSNIQVDLTGPDTARATTYLHAWHRFVEKRPDGILWARYEDELVRQQDEWLFAQRTLRVIGEQDFALHWIGPGA